MGRIIKCAFYVIFLVYAVNAEILNRNLERNIDLSTQLVKTNFKITVENLAGKPIKEYILLITEKNLAFISAKDDLNRELALKRTVDDNILKYTLYFESLKTTQFLEVEAIFTKNIVAHPEEIKQNEKQLVKYVGELYFYSPYKTEQQKTSIKLGSSNIISYTQVKPFLLASNKLAFGPYSNIEAFTNQELILHYENQSPFLTVNSLERNIEVSHWGNIAVKEDIKISHSGAKLKGSFSRYEFQKDGRSGQAAVRSYKTVLPASATSVYYRDTNGNISTSNMNILRNSVDLELRPRFPLFGGWKTQYTLGYNVPSYEYLYSHNNQYQLKMRVIDHIFDDMVIDEAVIKIILPEGASNIELVTPYNVIRKPNELFFTYLDTVGRPVVHFQKSNLVEDHIADFILKYSFSKPTLLLEPLLLVAFIFIIFVVTIIFMRLDFSISTHFHKD